jgi:hypothetical protein
MSSQEIADMVFNFKDKLTDKEFKDVMDKLSIKNKEEGDIYMVRYIKQKKELTQTGDGLSYKFLPKYKQKKVKLYDYNDEDFKEIIDKMVKDKLIEMIGKVNNFTIPTMRIRKRNDEYFIEPTDDNYKWCNNPYDDGDENNEEENRAKDKGVFVCFNEFLIIDIKKL